MLRVALAGLAIAALGMAEGFSFTIGSPVAAHEVQLKMSAFVFRTEGCAEPAKAQVSASAEGIVNGQRRSINVKVTPAAKAGVYGIYQSWPAEGQWVVILKGACADSSAGAIVPIGPKGFIRESSKFFSRPATENEIEASLKTANQGGNK